MQEKVREKPTVRLSQRLQDDIAILAAKRKTTKNEMLENLLRLGIATYFFMETMPNASTTKTSIAS